MYRSYTSDVCRWCGPREKTMIAPLKCLSYVNLPIVCYLLPINFPPPLRSPCHQFRPSTLTEDALSGEIKFMGCSRTLLVARHTSSLTATRFPKGALNYESLESTNWGIKMLSVCGSSIELVLLLLLLLFCDFCT
jgi:hypothetical protein